MSVSLPRILFFNVNGSGMGHLNRCLAYARRLQGRANPVFFSLASAIEIIEEMGFEADYFVSHYWSSSSSFAWNSELAIRLGMVLERVRPSVVVFDGTWPFQGLMAACKTHGAPAMVWSNRGLMKAEVGEVPVDEGAFDLVIQPGELGSERSESLLAEGGRRLVVPPVCLLDEADLMDRQAARAALGLSAEGRYVLFSLGPGNLKDVAGIGHGLIAGFEAEGFEVVWAQAPISVRDVALPPGVRPVSLYPLARLMRAFDAFVGAAGYNTCCEVVQAGIPALLVPNAQLVDDQSCRARMVTEVAPAVVSACETESERMDAVRALLALPGNEGPMAPVLPMNGASIAAAVAVGLWVEPAPVNLAASGRTCSLHSMRCAARRRHMASSSCRPGFRRVHRYSWLLGGRSRRSLYRGCGSDGEDRRGVARSDRAGIRVRDHHGESRPAASGIRGAWRHRVVVHQAAASRLRRADDLPAPSAQCRPDDRKPAEQPRRPRSPGQPLLVRRSCADHGRDLRCPLLSVRRGRLCRLGRLDRACRRRCASIRA